MNNLEQQILNGACRAQRKYTGLTGFWLWHAPESFLQTIVAIELGKTHTVYVDASLKKSKSQMRRRVGRPASGMGRRPDISVWAKTGASLRAVVEIKQAWNINPVVADAKKVETMLKKVRGVKAGYILVYSDAKKWANKDRVAFLKNRFNSWAKKIAWQCVGMRTGTVGDDKWAWGFCLLRRPSRTLKQ